MKRSTTSPGLDSRFMVMAVLVETCHIDKKLMVTRHVTFRIHQSACPNNGVVIFEFDTLEHSEFARRSCFLVSRVWASSSVAIAVYQRGLDIGCAARLQKQHTSHIFFRI